MVAVCLERALLRSAALSCDWMRTRAAVTHTAMLSSTDDDDDDEDDE